MNKAELIQFSGLHKIFRPFFAGNGCVFLLHRVTPGDETAFNKNLQVTPGYLENVIKFLIDSNIDIVSLDECYERLTGRRKSKRFAAFTFDDGYRDNLTDALPLFEKYNKPFTIFITTAFTDHKKVFWGYSLENMVMNNNIIKYRDGDKLYSLNAYTQSEKAEAYYKLKLYLKSSIDENFHSRLISVFGSEYASYCEKATKLMLSWEEVTELSKHPLVTIGAHSVNHFVLSSLSEKEAAGEIDGSAQIISRKTGKQVKYFAYPFGGSNEAGEREFRIAESCGMNMAFTANNGNIFKHHSRSLTSLPRIGLNENWTTTHIDLFINGFTPFLNKFRSVLKR